MYLHLKFGGRKNTQNGRAAAPKAVLEEVETAAPPAPPILAAPQPEPPSVQPFRGGAPRIKTYIAESVPQAMGLARREMGEEAILIHTKRRETPDSATRFEVT